MKRPMPLERQIMHKLDRLMNMAEGRVHKVKEGSRSREHG
jgi:hypothetical protein